ncbi:MAG: sulfite exporter TauE/SafE family protein [Usitatibacter sp.]
MSALALAAFLAGILGGVHCIGMCGGIVGSLAAASRGSAVARHLAFNAGRITSYGVAGAAMGAAGALLAMAGPLHVAQVALFVVANGLMLGLGLYIAGWGRAVVKLEGLGATLWRRIEPARRAMYPVDSTAKALGAGAAWGWVPCGLVYGMLPLAAASGGPVQGALVMVAFGLGTLPHLLLAGFAAQRVLALRKRPWVRRAAGLLIVALAIVGFSRVPGLPDMLRAGWACIS